MALVAPLLPLATVIELTAKDVEEFRDLYRQETGCELTEAQARSHALSIIQLVGFLVQRNRVSRLPADDP
jgi:hypothetical protein